ncbi:MAG TPA: hypothetical protein VEB60_00885 [Candidatus Paceibacterota bacterium]|nr:hypothetical protein [Candidatus Paceibacterota bacterium]
MKDAGLLVGMSILFLVAALLFIGSQGRRVVNLKVRRCVCLIGSDGRKSYPFDVETDDPSSWPVPTGTVSAEYRESLEAAVWYRGRWILLEGLEAHTAFYVYGEDIPLSHDGSSWERVGPSVGSRSVWRSKAPCFGG